MTGVQARNFSQNVQGMHKKWVNLCYRDISTLYSVSRYEGIFSRFIEKQL